MRLIRLGGKDEVEGLHRSTLEPWVTTTLPSILSRYASSADNSVKAYAQILQRYSVGQLLVMPVEEMRDLVLEVDAHLPRTVFYRKTKKFIGAEKEFKEFNAELRKCFDYERFLRQTGSWCAGALAERLSNNLKYCPYCNAETICAFKIYSSGIKFVRSAFDHFFPRARYPFLGLSLYNLIPACMRCNSALKHEAFTNLTEVAHPYANEDANEDMHNGMKFQLIFTDSRFLSYCSPDSIADIRLTEREKGKFPKGVAWDNLFKVGFCYKEIYRADAAVAYRRATEFPRSYFESKAEELKSAGFSSIGLESVLYGASLDPNEINCHRFGKLIYDIVETYRK